MDGDSKIVITIVIIGLHILAAVGNISAGKNREGGLLYIINKSMYL